MKFIRNTILFIAIISVISCNLIKSSTLSDLKSKAFFELSTKKASKTRTKNSESSIKSRRAPSQALITFIKGALKAYALREGKDQNSLTWTPLDSSKAEENFKRDVLIIFKTLFPENPAYEEIIKSGLKNEAPEALKKLLFQVYLNGLYLDEAKNEILTKVLHQNQDKSSIWPHPLASLVCHGGRTTLIFDKKTKKNAQGLEMDSLKTTLFHDKDLIKPRSTSTHKLVYDKKTNSLKEDKIKLEAGWDAAQSFFGHHSHYGMNFPIGGVGNFWPDGASYVGPEGYALTKKTDSKTTKVKFEKQSGLQHGHMYLRFHKLGESENNAAIMFGMENEEPGNKGMFSKGAHNALSAFKKSGEGVAVCGGLKWEALEGITKPNSYGGRAVFIKNLDFSIFDKIEAFDLELKKKVWWIILSSNNEQFLEFYKEFLNVFSADELLEKLDGYTKERRKRLLK